MINKLRCVGHMHTATVGVAELKTPCAEMTSGKGMDTVKRTEIQLVKRLHPVLVL